MTAVQNLSRRGFLKGVVATSSLLLGARVAPAAALLDGGSGTVAQLKPFVPNVFLAIDSSGAVTIFAHRSEMGTGIRTVLPSVVADELECDWQRVSIEQAVGADRYGSQNTDGSRSIRDFFEPMRRAGAAARMMLEQAAATRWGVPAGECRARNHEVAHAKSGKRAGFAELVEAAAKLPVPADAELTLKPKDQWRFIGKDTKLIDLQGLTTGAAKFGLDVSLPGMKYASIERCPVVGGELVSVDSTAALAVPGVEEIVELREAKKPYGFQALGGVAVVAVSTWAALQGRRQLKIEWDFGRNGNYDSVDYRKRLEQSVRKSGKAVRTQGDVDKAFGVAANVHEAEYYLPHLAHAPMAPPSATAHVKDGACEVWAATQNPQAARDTIAAALRMKKAAVTVHVPLLGGGFGRKSKPDFAAEAALLSREVGAPVKVTWTREDDIRHDYYHSVAALYLKAGMDKAGKPTAWLQRTAFPSIMTTFNPLAREAGGFELGLGFTDLPYAIDNLRAEVAAAAPHVRIGWLRSVCNVFHAFAIYSFTDELAALAKRDPLEYVRELIGPAREIDLAADGVDYPNYGAPIERFPFDTGRLRKVLDVVAEKAGWGRELPAGRGLGLCVHRSFLSYVAMVVEVEVSKAGVVKVPRVDVAVDCGLAVNPDRVIAQLEGAVVFGASLAMSGEITAREGRVQQSNFHDYPVARMADAPRNIEVHLVESGAPPAGVGEPGVPPYAPALCNAIFAATGKRVRSLPLSQHDLSWG